MQTKSRTLLALLVECANKPAFEVASDLGISSSSLTRHCQGTLRKPAVLKRAAAYFTKLVGGEIPVDDSLLMVPLTPQGLIYTAGIARTNALRREE
jgi:hypothetical protein